MNGAATRRSSKNRRRGRRGLSLLEVILAMAILGGALAVIGELVRLGTRSAATARDLTTAQIHCEAKMAEIAAGFEPPSATGPTPLAFDPEWTYQIESTPIDGQGLLGVQVTVTQTAEASATPATFTLVRWLIDPAIDLPDPPPVEETTEESTESSAAAP